ncbi:MAG: zinc ribbon domain-containing protein [Streptococcaceae bacterium]|jgi:hypothetical protein|nr:zinc ribbon domain-containing protein [Streptococcaceae bacterium]
MEELIKTLLKQLIKAFIQTEQGQALKEQASAYAMSLGHEGAEFIKAENEYYKNLTGEGYSEIIRSGIVAASDALVSGILPGVGGVIALATSAGAIWYMYVKINNVFGIKFSENMGKTIAGGVAANLASTLAVYIGAALVGSLVPGLGVILLPVIIFASTIVAAVVYLQLCIQLFSKYNNSQIESLDDDTLHSEIKASIAKVDTKSLFKDAFKEGKKLKNEIKSSAKNEDEISEFQSFTSNDTQSVRFCSNCGAQIEAVEAKFCPNCGARINP